MTSPTSTLGFIHDGYTRPGYIKPQPHLYPALRFQFRPMLVQNRSVILRQINDANDPRKEEELAARAVKSQLTEWDLKDHTGRTVDIDVKNVLRMEPNLMTQLFQIVIGSRVSDDDPQWTDEEQTSQNDQALERALTGAGPEEEEAADVGNSAAGCC